MGGAPRRAKPIDYANRFVLSERSLDVGIFDSRPIAMNFLEG